MVPLRHGFGFLFVLIASLGMIAVAVILADVRLHPEVVHGPQVRSSPARSSIPVVSIIVPGGS